MLKIGDRVKIKRTGKEGVIINIFPDAYINRTAFVDIKRDTCVVSFDNKTCECVFTSEVEVL